MSGFDPKQFLDANYSESNDTKLIPVPVGEYTAVVEKVDTRAWQGRKDPSKSGIALDVVWAIDDPAVKEATGREKVTVTQGIMLDLTPAGGLDFSRGKNVQLGRLREALGLNQPGQPFGFRMLEGKVAKVVIGHRPAEGANARPGDVFADVTAVVKL